MSQSIIEILFRFNSDSVKLLERLVAERGAPSKGEVIEDAIVLLEWAHRHVKDGYKIFAEKDGEYIQAISSDIFPDQKSVSRNDGDTEVVLSNKCEEFA